MQPLTGHRSRAGGSVRLALATTLILQRTSGYVTLLPDEYWRESRTHASTDGTDRIPA